MASSTYLVLPKDRGGLFGGESLTVSEKKSKNQKAELQMYIFHVNKKNHTHPMGTNVYTIPVVTLLIMCQIDTVYRYIN